MTLPPPPGSTGSSDEPNNPSGSSSTPPSYPPPPGGYGNYGGYPPPPPQPYSGYSTPPQMMRNGLGIAALVVALLSLPAAVTIIGGLILGITAIVLGFMGRGRASRGEANNGGVAVAGIVLGALGVLLSLVLIVVAVVFGRWFMDWGGRDYFDCMQDAGNDRVAQAQCEDEFRGRLEEKFGMTTTPSPAR